MWTAVIICHPQGQIHNLLLAGFSFSDEIQWVRVNNLLPSKEAFPRECDFT